MFPDNVIAKKFTLGAAKVAYVIAYGLAPYFESALTDQVAGCDFYVASFDEALNDVAQRGQMDIILRFWDSFINQVNTRYLSSMFLGHATAAELEKNLKDGLAPLSEKKLIQISMDGPNVNLKLLNDMRSNRGESDRKLIDIGTCGLHVVHGAFQTGHTASGWFEVRILYSDFKPLITSHLNKRWQQSWKTETNNKLQRIQPLIRPPKLLHLPRRDEVIIHRLRVSHTHLTHSYLFHKENPPECDVCHSPLTVEHFLVSCSKHELAPREYLKFSSSDDILAKPSPCAIVSFIQEIGYYHKM
jgi:hypothetical protein